MSDHPSQDIAIATGFWFTGLIFYFFAPGYLEANGFWTRVLEGLSYLSYAIALMGLLLGIERLTKKEVFQSVGVPVFIGGVGYVIHVAAENAPYFWMKTALKILVLFLVLMTLMALAMGVGQLFIPRERGPIEEGSTTERPAEGKSRTPKEQLIGVVVAIATLITAVIQFAERWMFG